MLKNHDLEVNFKDSYGVRHWTKECDFFNSLSMNNQTPRGGKNTKKKQKKNIQTEI